MALYNYASSDPIKVSLTSLQEKHQRLLAGSKTFCIYPWIHLHAYPTGEAWPCCHAEMKIGPVGNCKHNTLEQIWNSAAMRQLRVDMLQETPNSYCTRCYEQEESGFFSGRQSANKHHGHHIARVDCTDDNGHVSDMELTYWDIRFSNLCNLRCRSCGHIFSSNWYADQVALAGPQYKSTHDPLNFAGRWETDIWEQLVPHLDYVEQIYFAGGEPLLMEEHYQILDELDRRQMYHVRLIYNTNFTHTDLKGRSVFDYWRKFKSVSVGASLDASGAHAEYLRKGTQWPQVVENRRKMLETCPNVDFYISPTVSLLNALHLPKFHKEWVSMGLIHPQDLNVNILQDPPCYRIDVAPEAYKNKIEGAYRNHLSWLENKDPLNRATVGFQSAINFLWAKDNTALLSEFWRRTNQLDQLRQERWQDAIPELEDMHESTS